MSQIHGLSEITLVYSSCLSELLSIMETIWIAKLHSVYVLRDLEHYIGTNGLGLSLPLVNKIENDLVWWALNKCLLSLPNSAVVP